MDVIWSNKENKTKSVKAQNLDWILQRADSFAKRYLEAEKELLAITELPWYKRLFVKTRIVLFIKDKLEIYDY